MAIDPIHLVRFDVALGASEPDAALYALAKTLRDEAVSQLALFELYFRYQQRLGLSPEEDRRYDAVVDNLEVIHSGPWAKRWRLFPGELSQAEWSNLPREPRPPWFATNGDRSALDAEACAEIGPGHVLSGETLTAIARRRDRDDVLFSLRGSLRVAQVHLTWAGKQELDPYPATQLFASILEWFDSGERGADE